MLIQALRQSLLPGVIEKDVVWEREGQLSPGSSSDHSGRRIRCGLSQRTHHTMCHLFFFLLHVRLYNILDYWNIIKIFGSKGSLQFFEMQSTTLIILFGHLMLPPFLEEPIIPAKTFVCCHVDMVRWQKSQNFKRSTTGKKNL